MTAVGPEQGPQLGGGGGGAASFPLPAPSGARSIGTRLGPQYFACSTESSSNEKQARKCPSPSSVADGTEAALAGATDISNPRAHAAPSCEYWCSFIGALPPAKR